jgi:hypothetical protein
MVEGWKAKGEDIMRKINAARPSARRPPARAESLLMLGVRQAGELWFAVAATARRYSRRG